jgi:hypothetical protein
MIMTNFYIVLALNIIKFENQKTLEMVEKWKKVDNGKRYTLDEVLEEAE